MSVASRVFRGYGNGTVVGAVADRVHRGYTVFIPVAPGSFAEEITYTAIDSNINLQHIDSDILLTRQDSEVFFNG